MSCPDLTRERLGLHQPFASERPFLAVSRGSIQICLVGLWQIFTFLRVEHLVVAALSQLRRVHQTLLALVLLQRRPLPVLSCSLLRRQIRRGLPQLLHLHRVHLGPPQLRLLSGPCQERPLGRLLRLQTLRASQPRLHSSEILERLSRRSKQEMRFKPKVSPWLRLLGIRLLRLPTMQ